MQAARSKQSMQPLLPPFCAYLAIHASIAFSASNATTSINATNAIDAINAISAINANKQSPQQYTAAEHVLRNSIVLWRCHSTRV
eukprot:5112645-Lingulodinium_polyedra.AAC.1